MCDVEASVRERKEASAPAYLRGGGEEGRERCTGGNAQGGRRQEGSATRELAQNTAEGTRKARGESGNAPAGRGEGWRVRKTCECRPLRRRYYLLFI